MRTGPSLRTTKQLSVFRVKGLHVEALKKIENLRRFWAEAMGCGPETRNNTTFLRDVGPS